MYGIDYEGLQEILFQTENKKDFKEFVANHELKEDFINTFAYCTKRKKVYFEQYYNNETFDKLVDIWKNWDKINEDIKKIIKELK